MKKFEKKMYKYYKSLNDNKIITGVIMIIMNISSRYITFELSNSQEYYLKNFVGKKILIFTVLWMGTRDILISLILTIFFLLFSDYLLNDQSKYCIIPDKYRQMNQMYELDPSSNITQKEIENALHVLKIARNKKMDNSGVEDILFKENFI
tara:strand:+ start:130 stop:582 length:453 start_codon:yes stop_codon:yes gene_type:complete